MYYTGYNSNWGNSCCPNNNIGWIYPYNNNSNYAIIIVLFILLVIIIGTRWGR